MCGRLNVIDDPLAQQVFEQLKIRFTPSSLAEVCPGQNISAIANVEGKLDQRNGIWGLKPEWANRLLINAKVEGVESKSTFKDGYANVRIAIPCSGWYEWQLCDDSKVKYLFRDHSNNTLYMAAIGLKNSRLVTLTTQPNLQCSPYHHRMPLLLHANQVESWILGNRREADNLLSTVWNEPLDIVKC
ncbi:SOS response-associated peptidase family protein [Vibrio sonorensis]|uniref:SOS response-associated peptidase family protein n=1 Tax=Vibrio sonorensis TaxID=1004316 RepID=UPI0008D8EF71|nr:SOS response-associated peptidase family protein [Vibrio sonorensis]